MVRAHGGSERFLFRLVALIGEQLQLGASRALSFLAADPGDLLLFRGTSSLELRLDFIQQNSSSQKTIECLRALSLALHPNARGPMVQYNTSGNFVDVLTTGSRRPNKVFLDVLLLDTQGPHPLQEELLFFR